MSVRPSAGQPLSCHCGALSPRYGGNGQLGIGSTQNQNDGADVPVVGSGSFSARVTDLQCGERYCCLLLADGNMWCWGQNNVGQLGDGTEDDRDVPVLVADLAGKVVSIRVEAFTVCALTSWGRGQLYCWASVVALLSRCCRAFVTL